MHLNGPGNNQFMRNGSEVFTCFMDMTKAFDLVCMTFTKKPLFLCSNSLPWVESFKNLGNTVVNTPNFSKQNININRAKFVTKNIELNQSSTQKQDTHRHLIEPIIILDILLLQQA